MGKTFIANNDPGLTVRALLNKSLDAQVEAVYQALLEVFGSTGLLPPLADANHEASPTTFSALRASVALGAAPVWTYGPEDPDSYDTAPDRTANIVPVLHLNGSDEEITSPDADVWTRGDGAVDFAFAGQLWFKISPAGTIDVFLAKWDQTSAAEAREWQLYSDASDILHFNCYDESANAQIGLKTSAAVTTNVWHHLAWTKSTGITSAALNLWVDAVDVATAVDESGAYVATENLTTQVRLGAREDSGAGADFFAGSMALPVWAHAEIDQGQVERLFNLQRHFFGV